MASIARNRLVPPIVAALVLAIPAIVNRDSFPLSTYPMYASRRERVATFTIARGLDDNAATVRLSMREIAGTDDPLIAQARLRDAIAAGQVDDLCRQIARRSRASVSLVEVVDERHDIVRSARGEPSLLGREVRASCEAR